MRKMSLILVFALLVAALAGCSGKSGETASVQSVSMICGLGTTGLADRYAGCACAFSGSFPSMTGTIASSFISKAGSFPAS